MWFYSTAMMVFAIPLIVAPTAPVYDMFNMATVMLILPAGIMFALTTSYVVVVIVELWTAFGMYSDSGSSISTSGLDDLNLYNTGSWLESTVFTVNVRSSRALWVATLLMSCCT